MKMSYRGTYLYCTVTDTFAVDHICYCFTDCTVPPPDMLLVCTGNRSRTVAVICCTVPETPVMDHSYCCCVDCTTPPADILSVCSGSKSHAVILNCTIHGPETSAVDPIY